MSVYFITKMKFSSGGLVIGALETLLSWSGAMDGGGGEDIFGLAATEVDMGSLIAVELIVLETATGAH